MNNKTLNILYEAIDKGEATASDKTADGKFINWEFDGFTALLPARDSDFYLWERKEV